MQLRRGGFTMVEMVLVIMISSIVLGMGTRQFGKAADQRAVANARDAFIMTAHRARSEAMRSGRLVHLSIRPGDGLAEVETDAVGALHVLDVSDYGVTMTGDQHSVCYTSRGYALDGCTTIASEASVEFVRGTDTAEVAMLPLGQVRRVR